VSSEVGSSTYSSRWVSDMNAAVTGQPPPRRSGRRALPPARTFPAAAFVWAASLGIARSALLPASVAWVGGVVGLFLLVNAGGRLLADSSEFAPGGTVSTIAFAFFLFWTFVASVFLMQRVPVARRTAES
jgi:hypothetical protein